MKHELTQEEILVEIKRHSIRIRRNHPPADIG